MLVIFTTQFQSHHIHFTKCASVKTTLNRAICRLPSQPTRKRQHVKLEIDTKLVLKSKKKIMLRYCCRNFLRKSRAFLNYNRIKAPSPCNISLQSANRCEIRDDKLKAVVDRLAAQNQEQAATTATAAEEVAAATAEEEETAEDEEEIDDEKEEERRRSEAAWRSVKTSLAVIGATFAGLSGVLVYMLGKPPLNEDGDAIYDEYSDLPLWQQYFYRTVKELDYYKRLIKEPSREKLLPDVMQYPYYQPPYTLVLELTDVLVHPEWTYQTGWRFKKRPGIDYFLESLHGMYEVVIYTAEQGMTVFPILEALDPKNYISYKLVRDATHFVDGSHVKSLDKLNRDLSKVIVIDWNQDNVKFHKDNLLHLPRWSGDDDDTTMVDLVSFLQTIAQTEVADVREVLKYYSEFENPLQTFRMKQQELLKLMESQKVDRDKKDKTRMLLKF